MPEKEGNETPYKRFNKIKQLRLEVDDANRVLFVADMFAAELANLLKGRLKEVLQDNSYRNHELLRELKRELAGYNTRTGQWKD